MTALVWRGKCLRMHRGKRVFRHCVLAGGETGTAGNPVEQCELKPCRGMPFDL